MLGGFQSKKHSPINATSTRENNLHEEDEYLNIGKDRYEFYNQGVWQPMQAPRQRSDPTNDLPREFITDQKYESHSASSNTRKKDVHIASRILAPKDTTPKTRKMFADPTCTQGVSVGLSRHASKSGSTSGVMGATRYEYREL